MPTPDPAPGESSTDLRLSAVLFGAELRRARDRAGLTQTELGVLAGLSKNGVYALEKGRRSPNLETILRLCEGLSLRPGELMDSVAEAWEREP